MASRLATAAILGAIVGAERGAITFNLGVRCVTLLTVAGAMAAVGGAAGAVVAGVGCLVALGVFVMTCFRERQVPHRTKMSAVVGLCVGLGGGCGGGLPILTVTCYLAAVALLRGAHRQRASIRRRKMVLNNAFVKDDRRVTGSTPARVSA